MKADGYQAHIDGLRAVAVLAVILYHLDARVLPAGYVGVDVFFVISGYLITGIVKDGTEDGTFSFWEFYARRVRRIYPALILVIAVTLVASAVLMLPADFGLLADSARWSALGVGNFYFWSQTGYFAPAADTLPLLHTWSLGVEEQFYLVWPLLVVTALPMRRRLRWPRVILPLALTIASAAYAAYLAPLDSDQLFYSPLARAWELGLGASLAFMSVSLRRTMGNVIHLIGAASIAVALSGMTQFGVPLACAGALLMLIPAVEGSLAHRLLGVPPVAFVGRISYSLYLWHWPILVLYAHFYLLAQPVPLLGKAVYLAAVFVLSVVSWRWVELPFRRWRVLPLRPLLAGTLTATTVFILGSTALEGWPWRIPEAALRYLLPEYMDRNTGNPPDSRCFITSAKVRAGTTFTPDLCLTTVRDKPNVLLIGDSHANQFIGALRSVYPEINFSQATASGCYSLLGDVGEKRCVDLSNAIFGSYLDAYHFDAVIISSRWREGRRLPLIPATVESILASGSRFYILGPNLEYRMSGPQMLAYEVLRNLDLAQSLEVYTDAVRAERTILRLLGENRTNYFSTIAIMCPGGVCSPVTPDDKPVMGDVDHLSAPGAQWVMERLREDGFLEDLLPAATTP